MPDQIGTVINGIVDGTQASVDITTSDLEGLTPKGVIIFSLDQQGATEYGVHTNINRGGYGFCDDSGNQASIAWSDQSGVAPANTASAISDDHGLIICNASSSSTEAARRYFVECITNGVRLTKVINSGNNDFFVQIVAFGGDLLEAWVSPRQSGSGPVTGIPFQPNMNFAISDGTSNSGTFSSSSTSNHNIGWAFPQLGSVAQASFSAVSRDGESPTINSVWGGIDAFLTRMNSNSGNVSWQLQHDSYAPGQHNYTGDTGTQGWWGLYIKYGAPNQALSAAGNLPSSPTVENAQGYTDINLGIYLRMGFQGLTSPTTGGDGVQVDIYGQFILAANQLEGGSSFFWNSEGDVAESEAGSAAAYNSEWLTYGPGGPPEFECSASPVSLITNGYTATWNVASSGTDAFWVDFAFDYRTFTQNIILGENRIIRIYHGSDPVEKIYIGGNQI